MHLSVVNMQYYSNDPNSFYGALFLFYNGSNHKIKVDVELFESLKTLRIETGLYVDTYHIFLTKNYTSE